MCTLKLLTNSKKRKVKVMNRDTNIITHNSNLDNIRSYPNNHDPAEENLILFADNNDHAYELLKSEAEKLLEEGWEVICISKRSYIAVQDNCEIYISICNKGVSARIFQYGPF